MDNEQKKTLGTETSPEGVFSEIFFELERTLDSVKNRLIGKLPLGAHHWNNVYQYLEMLPLTTGEFGLAKNHLCNAAKYHSKNEAGAATYELKLMLGQLRQTIFASNC